MSITKKILTTSFILGALCATHFEAVALATANPDKIVFSGGCVSKDYYMGGGEGNGKEFTVVADPLKTTATQVVFTLRNQQGVNTTYIVDAILNRSDIRVDTASIQMRIAGNPDTIVASNYAKPETEIFLYRKPDIDSYIKCSGKVTF